MTTASAKRRAKKRTADTTPRQGESVRRKLNTDVSVQVKIDAVIEAFELISKGVPKGQADGKVAKALEVRCAVVFAVFSVGSKNRTGSYRKFLTPDLDPGWPN